MITQNRYKGLRKLANSRLELIKKETAKVERLIDEINSNLEKGFSLTKYNKGSMIFNEILEKKMRLEGFKYEIMTEFHTGEHYIEVS